MLLKLLYILRNISHFNRVFQLPSQASGASPRFLRDFHHPQPSQRCLQVHSPYAEGLLLGVFPFQENFDFPVAGIKFSREDGKLLSTVPDPGPGVGSARGKETTEWLKRRAQPGCGSPPGVPAPGWLRGEGPWVPGAKSAPRPGDTPELPPQHATGGPKPLSGSPRAHSPHLRRCSCGRSDGAPGVRSPAARQLLPARHMRRPECARLSPGAAPFGRLHGSSVGVGAAARRRRPGGRGLGGRARAEPPVPPARSLRNLVAPGPPPPPAWSWGRGDACSAPLPAPTAVPALPRSRRSFPQPPPLLGRPRTRAPCQAWRCASGGMSRLLDLKSQLAGTFLATSSLQMGEPKPLRRCK